MANVAVISSESTGKKPLNKISWHFSTIVEMGVTTVKVNNPLAPNTDAISKQKRQRWFLLNTTEIHYGGGGGFVYSIQSPFHSHEKNSCFFPFSSVGSREQHQNVKLACSSCTLWPDGTSQHKSFPANVRHRSTSFHCKRTIHLYTIN